MFHIDFPVSRAAERTAIIHAVTGSSPIRPKLGIYVLKGSLIYGLCGIQQLNRNGLESRLDINANKGTQEEFVILVGYTFPPKPSVSEAAPVQIHRIVAKK